MTRTTIRRITALILAAGLGAAVAIYLRAGPDAPDPLGYDPLEDKRYVRQLEMYGGKANVLAAQLTQWFDDRWHGRSLAYTVAFLTLLAAWGFRFVATHPDYLKPDRHSNGDRR